MPSVLQDWVMELTLKQQGVIVMGLRGPDGVAKEDVAKPIVRSLRGVVMVNGHIGRTLGVGNGGEAIKNSFMRTDLIGDDVMWHQVVDEFYGSIDQYNIHFMQHLLHAYEIVGYKHPIGVVAARATRFYRHGVDALHFTPEQPLVMEARLRDKPHGDASINEE